MIRLWLDDVRNPENFSHPGWLWVRTAQEAIQALRTMEVVEVSLDHDLGCCNDCRGGMTDEEWLRAHEYQSMPHCEHFGTGYTVACWMEENSYWPREGATSHSANPVGRAKIMSALRNAEARFRLERDK